MKKATDIKEIYHIFQPGDTINKDTQDLYVELFKKLTFEFVLGLEEALPNKTYLIAGQSGNGKSSALNMLSIKYPQLNKKYDFKYIYGRKNFEYLPKIDVADIVFNIAFSIIKDNEQLTNKFIEELTCMEQKFNKELEEKVEKTNNENAKLQLKANVGIGANILGFFKSKVDFESSYSLNDEAIKSAVEFFRFKKQDLISLVNDIILEYKTINNKELIIVIDDLEKRRDVNNLFISSDTNHAQLPILNDLNLIKIITMPIHIVRSNYVKFGELIEFGLKLKHSDGITPNEEDIELLKQVIYKRLENEDLINSEAIDELIIKSGANMNQLIRLIHKSALKSLVLKTNKITIDEVSESATDLQRELSSYVMNQRGFLNQIKSNNIAIYDEEDLIKLEKAILNDIIFAYFNGDTWFEINPVCEKSLEFYNKKAL